MSRTLGFIETPKGNHLNPSLHENKRDQRFNRNSFHILANSPQANFFGNEFQFTNQAQIPRPQTYLNTTNANGIQASHSSPFRELPNFARKSNLSGNVLDFIPQYDPYDIPPDLVLGEKHARASMVAKDVTQEISSNRCPCCNYSLEKTEIPYWISNKRSFDFLGSGFPLFYNFLRYSQFILVILILTVSFSSIISDINGNFCEIHSPQDHKGRRCHNAFFHQISLANIQNQPERVDLQSSLSLLMTILMQLFLLYFRHQQQQLDMDIDKKNVTPSDYTVLVRNIPLLLKIDYQEEIQQKIQFSFQGQVLVEKVNLIYDTYTVNVLKKDLEKEITAQQDFLQRNKAILNNPQSMTLDQVRQLQILDQQIVIIRGRINEQIIDVLNDPGLYFSGQAFITLRFESEQDLILQSTQDQIINPQYSKVDVYWNQRKLEFGQAPEPDSVNWDNIYVEKDDRMHQRRISTAMFITVLVLSFIIVYFLSYKQNMLSFQEQKQKIELKEKYELNIMIRIFQFSISIIIILINKLILPTAVTYFNDTSKFSNKTKYQSAYAQQLSFALFLNSALITFTVQVIHFENFYGIGGIIFAQTNFFVSNLILSPILDLVDFGYLYKYAQREIEKKRITNRESVMTQQQFHQLMEPTVYNQGNCYANIINLMWVTFLYTPLIPIAPVFSLLYLIIFNFIDKFNLIRRRIVTQSLEHQVSVEMIELLEICNVLFSFGCFFFYLIMLQQFQVQQIIQVVSSIIYVFIPCDKLVDYLFQPNTTDEILEYQIGQKQFTTSYSKQNPIRQFKSDFFSQYKTSLLKSQNDQFKNF